MRPRVVTTIGVSDTHNDCMWSRLSGIRWASPFHKLSAANSQGCTPSTFDWEIRKIHASEAFKVPSNRGKAVLGWQSSSCGTGMNRQLLPQKWTPERELEVSGRIHELCAIHWYRSISCLATTALLFVLRSLLKEKCFPCLFVSQLMTV